MVNSAPRRARPALCPNGTLTRTLKTPLVTRLFFLVGLGGAALPALFPSPARAVAALVDRDAHQPAAQRPRLVVLGKSAVSRDKAVLRQVERGIGVTDMAADQPE